MLSRHDERGFTLVELAVAMTLMLLVAGALLAALESGTTAEKRASTRIDDEQTVRVVLAQLTRDMRNADALLPGTTPNEVDLDVGGTHVRWWYDAAAHVLTRKAFDAATGGFDRGVSLDRLANPPGTMFTLVADDGTQLFTLAGGSTDDALACAATIDVSVTAQAHPPSGPFTETAAAAVHTARDTRGCP